MDKNQIIHIGFPKTGTTWFQKEFFPKVSNFSLIERDKIGKLLLMPFGNNFNAESLFLSCHGNGNNIIISDERILGGMLTGGYNGFVTENIANRLKLTFPNAKIILFIRNQFDAIASTYFHYVNYGGTYNINKFIHSPGYFIIQNFSFFSFDFFNYLNIISIYSKLFKNVDIYLYEDFNYNQKYFVNKLSDKYNLEINDVINYDSINSRYKTSVFYFKRFLNIFTKRQLMYKYYLINIPGAYSATNSIIELLNRNKIFGKKIHTNQILNKKITKEIQDFYSKPNKKLIEEYNLFEIKKYLYPL